MTVLKYCLTETHGCCDKWIMMSPKIFHLKHNYIVRLRGSPFVIHSSTMTTGHTGKTTIDLNQKYSQYKKPDLIDFPKLVGKKGTTTQIKFFSTIFIFERKIRDFINSNPIHRKFCMCVCVCIIYLCAQSCLGFFFIAIKKPSFIIMLTAECDSTV